MKKEDSIVYNEKPKRTSKVFIVIVVIIASLFTILPFALMIYSYFEFEYYTYDDFIESSSGKIELKKDIKIYDTNGFYDEDTKTYYIQGYLENNSNDAIESVYIEYLVYDKDDVLLGTAYGSIDNLKSDTKWKFKAIYSDIDSSEVNRFELSNVEFY